MSLSRRTENLQRRRDCGARPPTAYRAALLALSLLLIAAGGARAQVPGEPDLEQAQTLIAEGRPLEAFQMLEPFEAQFAGDVTFDYLLARAALDSGQPSRASFIYERILAVEPNYVGVRLESGRAYLDLGNYARAKQEFDIVLRFDNLPPDLRAAAEQYAKVAQEALTPQKTFLSLYAEYGAGYNDNINSAIRQAIVPLPGGLSLILDELSLQQGSLYHALNAGGQLVHRLTENWNVFAGADYRARLHDQEPTFDYHDLEGRLGVGYATGTDNVRLSGRVGRFFLNDDAIRDVSGLTVDWLRALDDRNQINTTLSYARYRFVDQALSFNDFDSYGVAVGLNHAFDEGRGVVGISVNTGYEEAKKNRLDGDSAVFGFNVSVQRSISDSLGAFFFAGLQRSNYNSQNALFLRTRHDTLFSATGGFTWSFAPGWSLRPQFSLSKNVSNLALNDYDSRELSLSVRKDF